MIGKFAPGLRGFPTPDAAAGGEGYLLFYFPDQLWAQYLLGACEPLQYGYNWYEAGSLQPDEAAEAFREIVDQAPYNLLDRGVDTPYWDDDADVDDEETPEMQPWYGYVTDPDSPTTTFVEDVGIWAFTGLLAVAGAPLAAIAFHTFAPRFVVAVRRGNLGEIIRLYVDGAEAAEVDTSPYTEGELINVPVLPEENEDGHDLMLVRVS